jgi:hypothetical protein
MPRYPALAAITVAFLTFASVAVAQEGCKLETQYVWEGDAPPGPVYPVSFVFTGVEDKPVVLSVDEMPIYEARLATEDWSTEFSGSTQCLMAGRYWINVRIGEVEGNLYFGVSEETTIYLSARDGVLTFDIWGPDAPGLD